jgi:hypothetical protein
LDRWKHGRNLSLAIRAEFGQADVIQFASGSTIDWRALETFIFKQNATIFEEKAQFALPIRVEAIANYGHVILAPFAIVVQLASVAHGIVKFESHTDLAVGLFADSDRILAGRKSSVDAKDAPERPGGHLADDRSRIQGTDDTTQNSRTPRDTSMTTHQSLPSRRPRIEALKGAPHTQST